MTGPPALPDEWARLSVLSPLVRSARSAAALAAVLGSRQLTPGDRPNGWFDLVVLGVAAAGAVVSWLVTRWRVHGGELQIDTGLVRRQSIRVPLTRLQAVDVVRPLLARALGLAEVRVVVAGAGSRATRLAYLPEARALQVRAALLAVAHGLDAATPAPPARDLLAVPPARLVLATLAGPGPLVTLAGAAAVGALVATDPAAAAATTGAAAAFVLALAMSLVRRVGAEWDFRAAAAPDGLRLSSGLLQHRAETVPLARVQAVRWVEPLLWRWCGWVRLEVDLARRHGGDRAEEASAATVRALLPVGTAADARMLLEHVLPHAAAALAAVQPAPRRARARAPLLGRRLGAVLTARYVAARTGRVRTVVVVVPLAKVQSLRWVQGPVSRRLRLASLHLDTAGQRFGAALRFRDAAQAEAWLWRAGDQARRARAGQA